jgi:hypothetical protein
MSTLSIKELLDNINVKVTAEQLELLEANLEMKKVKRLKHKLYSVAKVEFEAKTPLQLKQLVLTMQDEKEPFDKAKWAQQVALNKEFKTAQPIERIIAFYQKRMIDAGYITVAQ